MSAIAIPRKLPLLVIDDDVLLPGASMRIPVTHSGNIEMVRSQLFNCNTMSSTLIGILLTEPHQDTDRGGTSYHPIGTAAVVVQMTGVSFPHPMFSLLVMGLCRFRLEKLAVEVPYPVGVVTQLDKLTVDDDDEDNPETAAMVEEFRRLTSKLLGMLDVSSPTISKLKALLGSLPVHNLVDLSASIVNASFFEKVAILDALDLAERLNKILPLLKRHIKHLEHIRKAAGSSGKPTTVKQVVIHRGNLGSRMLDLLSKQEGDDELQELEKRLQLAGLPAHVEKVAAKELNRLKRLSLLGPESGIICSYLENLADLPWSKSSQETIDISKARAHLDADHYAMERLKRRVLEYLAVRQLNNSLRGPILCFVGPPGVGKTSVGRSVAQMLGREFHRISLGGICNQSDIRGHRRTYIGALPGRIIHGLKTAGTNNPVFLLDEVDKLGSGLHGDPAAALLEVLDPEQNCNFVDHYLNVPFDLSQVMFIATANTTKTIPAALLDRMEVIRVPGYTREEKVHITIRHLLPKQLRAHGLRPDVLLLPEPSIEKLVCEYTREAGVRALERKLCSLCRAVAVQVAESGIGSTETLTAVPVILDEETVEDILGPPPYTTAELWSRLGQPGVAAGLAWTEAGGEVMLVEAGKMEGSGEVVLTGHLGDVMKESARLALNWVRTTAWQYGLKLDGEALAHMDLHVHFPAGAVGKDGPSAGVTVAAALVSLFAERPLALDVAMTGELTLHGVVLPVGGIKEKVLAAYRSGFRRVILPKRCEKDLTEVPANVKDKMSFVPVTHMEEVIKAAFDGDVRVTGASAALELRRMDCKL